MSDRSAQYMAEALRLAEQGRYSSFPNPRVGCVVVAGEQVVGRGAHLRAGEPHAEVHALNQAGASSRGADLYVSLEPCAHFGRTAPCVEALIQAGVKRVWIASLDPNPLVAGKGMSRLREAGIEVNCGLLEPQARLLNRGFISRMERGRPFVTLKLGASLDGRTAMASGESRWITGEAARADVHRMRAEAGAVMTTAATVLADDPALTVRDFDGGDRQPDRIVIDPRGRVGEQALVWQQDGARRFWVVGGKLTQLDGKARRPRATSNADSMASVLSQLGEHEVNSVLIESGAQFVGVMLSQGLVDEVVCYLAPSMLGASARGMADLPQLTELNDRVQMTFSDVRRVGSDLRITAIPAITR